LALALVSVFAVAVTSGAAATKAVKPFSGRIYDASGHEYLSFVIDISASGRQVSVPAAAYDLVCGPGPLRGDLPEIPASAGTASLTRDGSFRLMLRVRNNPAITLVGTFVTRTKVSGTLSWHARESDLRGCGVQENWSANLRPLSDYFAGQTSTGASVTFTVTHSSTPSLIDFSVGGVPATCPAGSGGAQPGPQLISISDAYVGRILDTNFSAQTEDSNGIEFSVKGTVSGNTASGVVSSTDRTGCAYGDTQWSASFVRRGL
jgi:hypothetical protein